MIRWTSGGTLALVAGLALCGCGTSAPDPMAPFRSQKLAWAACDPTVVPGAARRDLQTLGDRATCAFLRVPIDYANPSRGEIVVALLRVAAEEPARRTGAIVMNPGGPGTDGLFLAPAFGALWSRANPGDPVGFLYKELSRTRDVIGFSPRGVGASTALLCASPEQMSFVANPSLDRSQQNVDAMLRNGQLQAEACGRSPLSPYVNTDATARDMDLLREVLRDPRLGYFGFSYGTWLGAWYASLFPDRVDRLLLSGVVDLTADLAKIFMLQPMGMQRVMDEVLAPFAALHPDTYLLGATAAEVRAVYAGLSPEVKQALNPILVDHMGKEADRDVELHALLAARVVDGILSSVPPPPDLYEAFGRVDAAVAFVPDDGRRAAVRDLVNQLIPACWEILDQATGSVELAGTGATFWSVVCNDGPFGYDVPTWVQLQDELAALYPIQGGLMTGSPCLYWGGASVVRPPLANASRAGNILLTQTELDPQTPLEGARASFAAMPTSSLIQVDGAWNHGVLVPSGNACVDGPVGEYLLHGTPPALRDAHCAAGPGVASRVFTDPAAAREILERVGRSIGSRPAP